MSMNEPVEQKKLIFLFSIFLDGLLLDQLSKFLLDANLTEPLELLPGLLRLQVEHNTGIAFSISVPFPLLILLNIVLFSAIIYYFWKHLNLNRWPSIILLAMLAAGAAGNLLDRLRLGYVIDFIAVGNFPVFNVADSLITIAIFLLLLFYDKIKRPN